MKDFPCKYNRRCKVGVHICCVMHTFVNQAGILLHKPKTDHVKLNIDSLCLVTAHSMTVQAAVNKETYLVTIVFF